MSMAPPDYYFRLRDNGALVFRVDTENRQRRIEMTQIAAVNIRNGEIKPHGDQELSEQDQARIRDWMTERSAVLAARELESVRLCIEQMNILTHWAQARASDAELEQFTEPLLLAMHDLRSTLVRKKAARIDAAPRNMPG